MKFTITSLLFLVFSGICISQNLRFSVHGLYTDPVKKEILEDAKTMNDIRPGFPSSWIDEFISTEISVPGSGTTIKATGINESLTAEQQSLLSTADIGNDIEVNIDYTYRNAVTGNKDLRQMHFVLTVVPEVEAEYPGGKEQLFLYFDENAIQRITEKFSNYTHSVIIRFTVTEKGEIDNARVSESSDDPVIDKILLKAIKNMPTWKSAENADGIKISQEFEFTVGNGGC